VSSQVIANVYSAEGSVAGSATVTFPWRPRKVVVTNDSVINNLTVTIKGQDLTLKPTETLTAILTLSSVGLSGTADYRVWGFG
jgi:hypothetical protein